ncbi:MAG: cation transporter [Methylotenera sp.]|jgi:Co/Zn/Cd efflux system component|uniref:cation transporter n=1 Tax=Methylotenera sp. TaxID=2051956 RepID=UPI0027226038|nr:cation transporter [Methylotenera sp.]MDO9150044.1 cation transporter [Methylotenera sp.]
MAKDCCNSECSNQKLLTPKYKKVLWVALVINATMFFVEILSGLNAQSVSLMADAIDFFGDAMNYGISLAVLSMSLAWRARAALFKGMTMGSFGLLVLAYTVWSTMHGEVPEAYTMGFVGFIALLANVSVAMMLYAYRDGDANMQSVWLCSRNDAIGNFAVMMAALGVLGSKSAWPDLIVAVVMASLGVSAAIQIIKQARSELNHQQ